MRTLARSAAGYLNNKGGLLSEKLGGVCTGHRIKLPNADANAHDWEKQFGGRRYGNGKGGVETAQLNYKRQIHKKQWVTAKP